MRLRPLALLAASLVALTALAQAPAPAPGPVPPPAQPGSWIAGQTADLALLDKVTAHTRMQAVPVGQATEFGTLSITVSRCLRRPPEEPAEAVAWIVVTERAAAPDAPPAFRGWMFATSPALHPLEHPVYDVRVIACR